MFPFRRAIMEMGAEMQTKPKIIAKLDKNQCVCAIGISFFVIGMVHNTYTIHHTYTPHNMSSEFCIYVVRQYNHKA